MLCMMLTCSALYSDVSCLALMGYQAVPVATAAVMTQTCAAASNQEEFE